MISVSSQLEDMRYPTAIREDEYINKDGLIYCRVCHTPRQKRFENFGKPMAPRCYCKCQAAAYEKREDERKQRDLMDKIAKNRSVGLPDPILRAHTFQNDLGYNPRQLDEAKRYVQHWEQFRDSGTGLLLWGNVGTGKSFIAGCIANALLDKGIPVIMTNFTRLLNKLTDLYTGDRNAYIDSFNRYPLMIIDDFGIERNTEFALEQVFSIIDSRCRSQLPFIVTTNLTLDELNNPEELAQARIYSRVTERCVPICVDNQNIRQLNQAETIARAKQLLRGT